VENCAGWRNLCGEGRVEDTDGDGYAAELIPELVMSGEGLVGVVVGSGRPEWTQNELGLVLVNLDRVP
jgi:hypothetical protein